jgi:CrcB protein
MSPSWLWQLVLVGTGGFAGSVCRFGLGRLVYRWLPDPSLPYGTLTVTVAGCFLIGLLSGWFEARGGMPAPAQLLLFAGFLGGFTTFSAFGYETMLLARDTAALAAALNVALHLGAGLIAVWVGASLFR